jgi:hypothetical protein
MKLSTELVKSSIGFPMCNSYRLITRHELSLLITFYCSLGQEERRIRFGAAVNDESIVSYCEKIDWRSTVVIVRGDFSRLTAVATNVRIDSRRVENATIWVHNGLDALPTLLRLSAVAAADLFAADQLIVEFNGAPWIVDQLREMGQVRIADDHAWLKIGFSRAARPSLALNGRTDELLVTGAIGDDVRRTLIQCSGYR